MVGGWVLTNELSDESVKWGDKEAKQKKKKRKWDSHFTHL